MSKKKNYMISILVVIVVALVVIVYRIVKYSERYDRRVDKDDLEAVLYIEIDQESGNICMVRKLMGNIGLYPSSDGCIYLYDFDYFENKLKNFRVDKINKANVYIYDLESKEIIKTIDIKAVMEHYLPNEHWQGLPVYIERKDDGDLFIITGTDDGDYSSNDDMKKIYINVKTDEVTILGYDEVFEGTRGIEEEEKSRQERTRDVYDMIGRDEIGIMEANGIAISYMQYSLEGSRYLNIHMKKKLLPKENRFLYAQFPGLKECPGEEDDMVSIAIAGDPTPEEILSMLIEEGEEISFEGCVLPAESSIDGKEHEIHSFEEYEQWKKYED